MCSLLTMVSPDRKMLPLEYEAEAEAAPPLALSQDYSSNKSSPVIQQGNHGSQSSLDAAAQDVLQESFGDLSSDSTGNKVRRVRRCSADSVKLGTLLGTGSFNDVYEASVASSACDGDVSCCSCNVSDGANDEKEEGLEISYCGDDYDQDVTLEPDGSYVIKHLKESLLEDGNTEAFRTGALDLAAEAQILSGLAHRNVITFHGVMGVDLVLEKLTCTLTDRVLFWRSEERPLRRGALPLTNPKLCRSRCQELLRSRLRSALDVADGIRYLHSRGIMHRDLKPENIGFDNSGVAKIFDFGLAKRVDPATGSSLDGSRHTGLVGTFRYMAPEVAKCRQYGPSVDAYSFGLILWEICTLDKAYGRITRQDFQERVVYGTLRPRVSPGWSPALQNLIMSCWDGNPLVRPNFDAVVAVLTRIIDRLYPHAVAEDQQKRRGSASSNASGGDRQRPRRRASGLLRRRHESRRLSLQFEDADLFSDIEEEDEHAAAAAEQQRPGSSSGKSSSQDAAPELTPTDPSCDSSSKEERDGRRRDDRNNSKVGPAPAAAAAVTSAGSRSRRRLSLSAAQGGHSSRRSLLKMAKSMSMRMQ